MAAPKEKSAAAILDRFYAAERIYMAAAPEDRDPSGMAATLSPSMRLVQSPDLPYGGVYEGLDGFLDWSRQMADLFDAVDVQNPRVFEKGDEVVVLITLRLRVRKTGEELINDMVQVVKVDLEKEVITEMQPFYYNVAGLNKAVGK